MSEKQVVITAKRLVIRAARPADAEVIYRLWTDPRVMTHVGFPRGLDINRQEIEEGIRAQDPVTEFGKYLMVQLKGGGPTVGECKMIVPDEQGVSRTDVKLLPEFWGHKYGVEIKQAMVDYLFSFTACQAVEGTPNKTNIASIRMQKAVGAVRVGEATFNFPESKAAFTTPVPHYIYHVRRTDWEKTRRRPVATSDL